MQQQLRCNNSCDATTAAMQQCDEPAAVLQWQEWRGVRNHCKGGGARLDFFADVLLLSLVLRALLLALLLADLGHMYFLPRSQ